MKGNYFVLVLNNTVDEGRYMGAKASWNAGISGTEGYFADTLRGTIGSLGHVYQNNSYTNDASMVFWDKIEKYSGPRVDVGMVIEDNMFKDCKFGITFGDGISGVIKNNKFENVETPVRVKIHSDIIRQ